jgi:hypothetical protein
MTGRKNDRRERLGEIMTGAIGERTPRERLTREEKELLDQEPLAKEWRRERHEKEWLQMRKNDWIKGEEKEWLDKDNWIKNERRGKNDLERTIG